MAENLTWKLVDDTAAELGAGEAGRLKWRQAGRGVPAEWRLKLIEHFASHGIVFSSADFDALPTTPGRIAA